MPDKVIAAFGQQRGEIILETIEKVNSNIPTYLFYKTLISMITGLLVTFMLKFFQIDFAVLWGLIAFLLNFIPNLGSIVAGFPPILLTLIQTESFTMTFIIFFCFFMIQMVIGQILDPRILGASLNISPIVIFFSLLFWGWLWGIVGMILCIPIADTIRIVCGNIPKLQWFSILISNTIETPKSAE
jgi:predicted PurR-regulated permease PerM